MPRDSVRTGEIAEYQWAEMPSNDLTLDAIVLALGDHLLDLRAVNVSWDSGLLEPTESELSAGWEVRSGYAVSPRIDTAVVDVWPACDTGYDEWYFFEQVPGDLRLSAFCNWTGRSLSQWQELMNVPDAPNLGEQLRTFRPEAVIGVGDRAFLIARARRLIDAFLDLREKADSPRGG
jgi:hypothetical protein